MEKLERALEAGNNMIRFIFKKDYFVINGKEIITQDWKKRDYSGKQVTK